MPFSSRFTTKFEVSSVREQVFASDYFIERSIVRTQGSKIYDLTAFGRSLELHLYVSDSVSLRIFCSATSCGLFGRLGSSFQKLSTGSTLLFVQTFK